MKELINKFVKDKDDFEKQLKNYFKDSSIPVTERWDVFVYANSTKVYHNIKNWIWHCDIIEKTLKLDWYDDFYIEKYQQKSFTDIIECIEENDLIEDILLIDKIKEEMLQSEYTGFVFDW